MREFLMSSGVTSIKLILRTNQKQREKNRREQNTKMKLKEQNIR